MATILESAKKLFIPDSYPILNLLNQLHGEDENIRKSARNLLNYSRENYPSSLIDKLFETIQRSSSSSITCIRCYHLLRDLLPPLWTKLSLTRRKELKIDLNYKIWAEDDYETLKACSSCVSSLASLLLVKDEWNTLFHFMFMYLGLKSRNRTMGALFLWNDLIPKCPEVLLLYVDGLIEGFMDLMPAVSEDHRCGVYAAKASVKLIMYFSTPASYSKFYSLLGHVIMTMFVAMGEEEDLVCSLLEDFIVLAGVQPALFKAQIGVTFESMVRIAENLELGEKTRTLAIEFVVTLAENRESGCEMVPKEVVAKLLLLLIAMMIFIEDDPSWGEATSDDKIEGELSVTSYATESLDRLAIALGGNIIVPNLPMTLFDFLVHNYWPTRYASVTVIGIISEGCSKVLVSLSKVMEHLVEAILKRFRDEHPRVRWASICTIGQLSKYLCPQFQEQYHQQLLPALIEVLDDFDNPRLMTRATSTILLFSHNCSADILKPYMKNIVTKLVVFLQRGMPMLKEAALATLASLAISSQEDSSYIYDSVMPYLKVIDNNQMLFVKSLEFITMITMAVGNVAIADNIEKVTSALILLQQNTTEGEDPRRCLLLQAWGRLSKSLGTDFIPYLSVAMPFVLNSATLENYLIVSENSDDSDDESTISAIAGDKKTGIRSALLEEKALACHMLCCFAAALKEGLHMWVHEVVSALVPNLTFEFSGEVRMAAISAMPLLLNSASCATKKGLPVTGCGKTPVRTISDTIISALLDALKKESNVQVQARLLEAFNESIKIRGSRLSKKQVAEFVDGISKVIVTCSSSLKEEAEKHVSICRNIGICLGTMVKKLHAAILPLFDKFLPYVSLMWSNDRTAEERRILVHLFRDIAEQCRDEVFRYYEQWIPLLPRVYYHMNPDVPQIVATAIGICAEFGGHFLKPHTTVIFSCFKTLMQHPDAKKPENIMAYEAAVHTCGKLIKFVSEGIHTNEFVLLWLNHLPISCNLDEAKISHELLCTMMEKSEQKVIGPDGAYTPIIIAVFAEVLWAGNNLATEETRTRIINLLRKFQREMQPTVLSSILETLPLQHRNMLLTVLFNV